MSTAEEKNLRTQLDLLQGICEADNMVLSCIQSTAMDAIKMVIEPKMYMDKDQKTVDLTVEEFTKIRLVLAHIASDEGLAKLNGWLSEKYLNPKKEKLRILNLLK